MKRPINAPIKESKNMHVTVMSNFVLWTSFIVTAVMADRQKVNSDCREDQLPVEWTVEVVDTMAPSHAEPLESNS